MIQSTTMRWIGRFVAPGINVDIERRTVVTTVTGPEARYFVRIRLPSLWFDCWWANRLSLFWNYWNLLQVSLFVTLAADMTGRDDLMLRRAVC
jgi:hypothetical protein